MNDPVLMKPERLETPYSYDRLEQDSRLDIVHDVKIITQLQEHELRLLRLDCTFAPR